MERAMQTLSLETPAPFVLPPDAPLLVVLVGAGGTGSHILQSLARLAAHLAQQAGPLLDVVVIDGDYVERKNVGRQLFAAADVGLNKAQALVARFNAVFGLQMAAYPEMANAAIIKEITNRRRPRAVPIIVGAVDTPAARRLMHDALSPGPARVWLDCGNEEHAGQVALGTVTDPKRLVGCLALGGVCRDLPAPSLLYPNLIDVPKKQRTRRGDCAAAAEANLQGLMVNQAIAAVAAQYLYQLIVERRVTTFETSVALQGLAMRSRPITATALAAATGLAPDDLTGAAKKKGKAAA
jgi:PRTRC genetic system ThiF family protein